jgi:hypothetical protein
MVRPSLPYRWCPLAVLPLLPLLARGTRTTVIEI